MVMLYGVSLTLILDGAGHFRITKCDVVEFSVAKAAEDIVSEDNGLLSITLRELRWSLRTNIIETLFGPLTVYS